MEKPGLVPGRRKDVDWCIRAELADKPGPVHPVVSGAPKSNIKAWYGGIPKKWGSGAIDF